jgi:putative ATP-grasp target RiPP
MDLSARGGPAWRAASHLSVPSGSRHSSPADIGANVTYVYDSERQITLVRDAHGEVVPLSKHTKPGPTPSAGTSETRDGDGSPPPAEEMFAPDYQQD